MISTIIFILLKILHIKTRQCSFSLTCHTAYFTFSIRLCVLWMERECCLSDKLLCFPGRWWECCIQLHASYSSWEKYCRKKNDHYPLVKT